MSIIERNTELLDRWKTERPEYAMFVEDGVLREESYTASSPRIAFLLKEGNADFRVIAPLPEEKEGWGPKGSSNHFWRKMNIAIYLLTKLWHGRMPSFEDAQSNVDQPVHTIAYINIKKNFENRPASVPRDIRSYAARDAAFIREQIDVVNPDIIYCGGTDEFIRVIDDGAERITNGVNTLCNRAAISYYHPAYGRQSLQQFYDGLYRCTTSEVAGKVVREFAGRKR